jgi:hypothetical protein
MALFVTFFSFWTAHSGGSPASAEEHLESTRETACSEWKSSGDAVVVRLENEDVTGAVLEVPRGYVASPDFREGQVRDALILSIWKQSFAPYTQADIRREEQRQKVREGQSDRMTILIHSALPLDIVAKRSVMVGYGLPADGPIPDMEGVPLGNGLFAQRPSTRIGDVFFAKDDGRMTDIIWCSRPSEVPSPGCTHLFEAGPYDVKASYYRYELPKWQTYKGQIESLLMCLTIHLPKQN